MIWRGTWQTTIYSMRRGLRGMSEAPLVQVLAIATTAVCMLLLGAGLLVWVNARGILESWGVDIPLTVYLVDDARPEDAQQLAARLSAVPGVERVVPVTPDMAMTRLAEGLGGDSELLDGVDPAILPVSLEVHVRRDVAPDFDDRLAERAAAFGVVEEVALPGEWADRAKTLLDTLGDVLLGAGCLVAFACLAIIWSTIRLAVHARRAEIQILQLVGGTPRFVRAPFLVEGALQGALSATLAIGLLYVGFDSLRPFLERGLTILFAAGALRFFTPLEGALGIGFGALLGVLGSRVAVGRYVES